MNYWIIGKDRSNDTIDYGCYVYEWDDEYTEEED